VDVSQSIWISILNHWDVDGRIGFRLQARVLYITYYPNNFSPSSGIRKNLNVLTDWTPLRKEASRHRLVDDNHVRSLLHLAVREIPALQNGNLHCLEIVCCDGAVIGAGSHLLRHGLALNGEARRRHLAHHWQSDDSGSGSDARHDSDFGNHPIVKLSLLW